MLVSAIIPTHNRSKLLQRAINSVLSQTYKNFEIIIIDDGSNDNTQNICQKFIDENENIRYIRNENSAGGAEARNIGMRQAKGEIITFLDDDDEWLPQKLEKQIEIFKQNPEVGIVGTNYFWIDVEKNHIKKIKLPQKQSLKTLLLENTLGSFSFNAIQKRLFEKYGGIRPDMKSSQDWHFWLKLAPNTKILITDNYLVKYYNYSGDPNRISSSTDRAIESRKKVLHDYQNQMSFFVNLKHKLWIWQRRNYIYKKTNSKFIKAITYRLFKYSHDIVQKILKSIYIK